MSRLFSLDSRLSACAELVRQDVSIADIGTDHAYLPIWLAKNNRIKSAIAADIRPLPLKSGEENIINYGCRNVVETRLSDGLDAISPHEVDDIVLAGMGGELITDIIERAEWLKNPQKHLIMQPMTKEYVLRKYLCDNGFDIIIERACSHSGKSYTVMLAVYSGNVKNPSPSYYYTGELSNEDRLAQEYMNQVLRKLEFKSQGRKHDGKDSSETDMVIAEIKKRFGVEVNDNSK